MTAQGVNITVLDGQLGQTVPGQGQTEVVVGVSASGTPNQPFTSNVAGQFLSNFGAGPGPRLAAFIAALTGNPVTFSKAATSGAGSMSTVYAATANTGATVMTVTGTPLDDYYLVAVCTQSGTFGTGQLQYAISIDGGATFAWTYNSSNSGAQSTAAFTTYTGLTLSFTAASFNTNAPAGPADQFYGVGTAPTWSDAGVQSAIQAVVAIKSQTFQDIMIAGVSAASDVVAFDGYMTTLANTNKRFSRLLCAARDAVWGGASTETEAAWMVSLETAFANSSSLRVGVCAGHYRFIDPFTQSQMRSSLLYGAASRDAAVAIQVDLAEVDIGALQNLVLPVRPDSFGNGTFFYHDEDQNPGLNAARFLAAWQIVSLPGVYIMNSNLMAPPGSDFNWLQHGHVIDEACSIAYQYFIQTISSAVRVSATTGYILPQERNRLQNGCNAQLANNLTTPGAVSSAACVVSGTDNILSTATLTVSLQVVPLGYIKAVNVTISFLNPAVVAVQQQT